MILSYNHSIYLMIPLAFSIVTISLAHSFSRAVANSSTFGLYVFN